MSNSAPVICAFLQKLLNEESIANQSISKTVKSNNTFLALVEAEAIVKTKKGGGHRWEAVDREMIQNNLDYLCPNSEHNIEKGERHNNTRKYRSSKAKKRESHRLVFLRGEGKIMLNGKGVFLSQSEPLGAQVDKLSAEKICFVENQENFMENAHLISKGWVLVYPVGRIGLSLMNRMSPHHVLHYGDLDYEGLNEFARIKEVFPQAELLVPENYYEQALKYGMEIHSKQEASAKLLQLAKR